MQGEQNANCGGPTQLDFYSCALPALINDWRAKFANPGMPFGVFLLAAWASADLRSFPLLRLLQVATSHALPAVFTASTLDAGEPNGGPVHSPYKQVPAARAAAALRALLYGDAGAAFLGPRATGARAAGLVTDIAFDPATLYGAPLALAWGGAACPPKVAAPNCESFAVLTSDCVWRSVEAGGGGGAAVSAAAEGGTLTLSLTGAPAGVYVVATRGYFANWPLVALRNGAGVPAEPWLLNVTAHSCAMPRVEPEEWAGEVPGLHA